MKTLMITGRITGMKDGNAEAFKEASDRLVEAGYGTVYWNENNSNNVKSGSAIMLRKSAVSLFTECDGMALITGWEHDQAALTLRGVCLDIGYPPVMTVDEWIESALSNDEEES